MPLIQSDQGICMHVLRVLTTQNNCQYVWAYVISSGGTICSSLLIIASRLSFFILTYLTVVSVPAENHNIYEPFMPALIKASSNITVHYTITAVQTMLTYVIKTTYSRSYRKMRGYEQRSPYPTLNHILPI
jgi:hypothetical protein